MRPDPLDHVRRALAPSSNAPAPADRPATAECLDDRSIAAFVDGTMPRAGRASAIGHVADCRRCQAVVASLVRALDDPVVARELATLTYAPRRRLAWLAPLAAAAALLLLVSRASLPDGMGVTHRAPVTAAASTPEPIAPIGTVAAPRSLLWHRFAGADRYRVVLFDANASELLETQLSDTSLALPDSIAFTPGRTYLWKVEARSAPDRWTPSKLVAFTIAVAKAP